MSSAGASTAAAATRKLEQKAAQERQVEIIHYNVGLRRRRGCFGRSVLVAGASRPLPQPLIWAAPHCATPPSLLAPLFPTAYPPRVHRPRRRLLLDSFLTPEEVSHFRHVAAKRTFALLDSMDDAAADAEGEEGCACVDGEAETEVGAGAEVGDYVCEGAPRCPVVGSFDEVSAHEKSCVHCSHHEDEATPGEAAAGGEEEEEEEGDVEEEEVEGEDPSTSDEEEQNCYADW